MTHAMYRIKRLRMDNVPLHICDLFCPILFKCLTSAVEANLKTNKMVQNNDSFFQLIVNLTFGTTFN